MSQDNHIVAAAAALRTARLQRQPVPRISETYGISDLQSAYAVAEINQRAHHADGHRKCGLKVGLTSKAVQQQLGVDQPDFGVLFDDMEYLDGDTVPVSRLIQPKVEAEIAFVVGRDMEALRPSYSEFLRCIDHAVAALEIVDSAIADWKITLVDTVADNASSGLYVLGNQPFAVNALSLADQTMTLQKQGHTVSEGSGAACLGHPLRAAYWLACTMAKRGQALRAGEVILSGALGPMVPVAAGDEIVATIGSLGTVSCTFA
ncbi:MAG: 2-keto-4-pentenoate hydratase [Hydrogenophaga sp.]|uniref:2-keto-4-pentenoate hydratase n=1 Tax=Hydrogenophaga sp. TaxID=1904254 RepID=UPI003D9BF72B